MCAKSSLAYSKARLSAHRSAILVRNKDQRPSSYDEMKDKYRPSHADYTYDAKYGIRAWHGGGRASARETIGRVAAAAVAKKVIDSLCPGIENHCLRQVHQGPRGKCRP